MNSRFQKIFIRVMAVVLAILMAASVLVGVLSATAGATTKDEIKELQDDLKGIQQKLKDIKAQINSLEYEQSVVIAQKQVLDSRIELTGQMIENLEQQIAKYDQLIDEKEAEVADRQRQEEEQWEKYKVRIRAMEENGTVSYYAIIFGANDFADMLSRIDMISSIMEYDNTLYDRLVAARQATQAAQVQLEETRGEFESTKAELQDAQSELEIQRLEAEALIASIQDDVDAQRALYEQADKDEEQLKKDLAKAEEEYRRQQQSQVKGTGQFMWPVDSNYVTSRFGGRDTGIAGASTNHKGIDIGRTGYGAKIYAADSGTVLVSSSNSSSGNYVVISHGDGVTTHYAHMSKRAVKAGQTVKKGDVIGYTGATGVTNGPHLHFEIRINGVSQNPLNYFKAGSYTLSPTA